MKIEVLEETTGSDPSLLSVAETLVRFRASLENGAGETSSDKEQLMNECLSELFPSESCTAEELVAWIGGYESVIRPLFLACLQETSAPIHTTTPKDIQNYVTTLQHYETILSNKLRHMDTSSSVPTAAEIDILFRVLHLLATDLDLLTSERYFRNIPTATRCDIAIPRILQLLKHALEAAARLLGDVENKGANASENTTRKDALR